MDVQELIAGAREAVTARRVYGEPYEKNGLTVIPAATIRGGAGGGVGDAQEGKEAGGGGFGVVARPVGAWVVKDGDVSWRPAVDVNRICVGCQLVALAAVVFGARAGRKHAHTLKYAAPQWRKSKRHAKALFSH